MMNNNAILSAAKYGSISCYRIRVTQRRSSFIKGHKPWQLIFDIKPLLKSSTGTIRLDRISLEARAGYISACGRTSAGFQMLHFEKEQLSYIASGIYALRLGSLPVARWCLEWPNKSMQGRRFRPYYGAAEKTFVRFRETGHPLLTSAICGSNHYYIPSLQFHNNG